jgi:hypothetical protein
MSPPCRASRTTRDLALEIRCPQVGKALQVAPDLALVIADAGEAALPGERMLSARVEGHVLEGLPQVGRVRHTDEIKGLHEAVPDDPVGHPVGQGEDVSVDVLTRTRLQLGLDLGHVGVVVVDVLRVTGLDAGLLDEGLKGRIVLLLLVVVQVCRPVGPGHRLVGRGPVRRQLGRRCGSRSSRRPRRCGGGSVAPRRQGRGTRAQSGTQGAEADPGQERASGEW